MARTDKWASLSTQTREALRSDLLSGRWEPGKRLQVGELSKLYGASTTVMREALTRLAGEQLVSFVPNRGFFVAQLTLDELQDLTELRCRIEGFGVALAIERGSLAWESELIGAHHRLERTPRRRADDPHHISPEWLEAHQDFHAKILEPCRISALIDLAATLADATVLYRQWTAPSQAAESRDIEAEHREILESVLARDAVTAEKLLREHYELTTRIITQSLG
ncbi:GntR family transcriptional regulator [Rhodococcus sp. HM1]|uniref:GntR family transcriptional regulator n=1 Tax=Rhodococcus sp. HM1 TaxID=2937759 RepID=UPI00200B7346|nr:GntR family transcriptional regulator [Rhodococcus sp. HM1]MCK8670717.1 GntR family transcriptional regulator [Rhodococcus sp. HM1]